MTEPERLTLAPPDAERTSTVHAIDAAGVPSERPPRVTTPPGGVPSQPVAAIDLWRDRARTVLDRFIYFGALLALVYLRRHDQLDVGTVAAILLVCGVRPHNVGDVLAARVSGGHVTRASAVVGAVGAGALTWRSFFGTTLLVGMIAGCASGGIEHAAGASVPIVRELCRVFRILDTKPVADEGDERDAATQAPEALDGGVLPVVMPDAEVSE